MESALDTLFKELRKESVNCADGILLLEVNRMLRAGGYFVWAAQPVYKHEEVLEEQWKGIIQLDFHS